MEEYRASGGYEALAKALARYAPEEVRGIVDDACLLGRGGAGFPAGRKWAGVARDAPFPRYIVSNADEMEPGTFKDRVLIHADPHQIIEGMLLAGYAVSAQQGILFVRPAYGRIAEILEREIEVARHAGFVGRRILGSGFSMEISVHRSAGRYICGEGTAQIHAIQGMRPHPRQTPPRTTETGLWGRPTVLNNVETLANVPHIVRHGADWFGGLARSRENSAGTKLYCVSGRVRQPGCYELPMGTPLREIIEEHAGGLPPGCGFKACLPGGASTRFLSREFYDVEMDIEPLKLIGHRLGTGAVIVFDEGTCLVAATLNLMRFFARESCGWCTPCREGLPYIVDLLRRIEEGEGQEAFIPMLARMSHYMRHAYCAFALGASQPVESLVTCFQGEVREHISQRNCPYGKRGGGESGEGEGEPRSESQPRHAT
jgi:NADH-quinone oxidoreductase subunit F